MRSKLLLGFALAAAVVCLSWPRTSPSPSHAADATDAGETSDRFRPTWHVGDRWTIETQTRQIQVGAPPGQTPLGKPVRWQFTVQGKEKVGGRDCFQVQVQCLLQAARPQPQTTLWVDAQSLALRQVQTQLTVGGQVRTLTESYQFPGQQPTPVMGPFSALPLDMPLLLGGRTKGSQSFNYEAIPGPGGTKAIGEMGFAFEVTQDLDTQPPQQSRNLLHTEFIKSLGNRPLLEVKLKTFGRSVKQLWQAGLPWPAYSENGTTVARLVNWTLAQNTDSEENR